jgi:hypothetical protein
LINEGGTVNQVFQTLGVGTKEIFNTPLGANVYLLSSNKEKLHLPNKLFDIELTDIDFVIENYPIPNANF